MDFVGPLLLLSSAGSRSCSLSDLGLVLLWIPVLYSLGTQIDLDVVLDLLCSSVGCVLALDSVLSSSRTSTPSSTRSFHRRDDNMKPSSAPKERAGISSLPTELIINILDYTDSAQAILALGATCHGFRKIVNTEAETLSASIIQRERKRLNERIGLSMRFLRPTLAGKSLLDAMRISTLHVGLTAHDEAVSSMSRIANRWMEDNHLSRRIYRHTDFRAIWALIEYLFQLDYATDLRDQGPLNFKSTCGTLGATCRCDECCKRIRDGKALSWVDAAVWRYLSHAESPLYPRRFYQDVSTERTRDVITEGQWIGMIGHVHRAPRERWPVRSVTPQQTETAAMLLRETICCGLEAHPWQWTFFADFISAAGLPRDPLAEDVWQRRPWVYVPKMTDNERKMLDRLPDIGCTAYTRSLKAVLEFCRRKRVRGGDQDEERKLLDPENLLLTAVVFEELEVQRGGREFPWPL